MFSDKNGLTAAVLAGTKTQTRRIVPEKALSEWNDIDDGDEYSRSVYCDEYDAKMRNFLLKYAPFKVGEVVAVSQKYFDVWNYIKASQDALTKATIHLTNGWDNKMLVRADLMPHRIRIEKIRIEKLQDISEDDCLAEGVIKYTKGVYTYIENGKKIFCAKLDTPKKAFAELIDRISGKGTFESNPFVFAYNFNLVK